MCTSAECVVDFLEISGVPVTVGALCATREHAHAAPKGDLRLCLCEACSYVWNRAYEPGRHDYLPGYEISLHYSSIYQDFLKQIADDLVKRYDLQGKTVVEIACGGGHFLRLLCGIGGNRGIGIDPVVQREGVELLNTTEITFIRDRFTERYANVECDFICCRQALHAIADPKQLVDAVRRTIGERRHTPVYFEVVNARRLFQRLSVLQLMYEYYSFFTAQSLARLFSESGFEIVQVGPSYDDGQYLHIEALPAQRPQPGIRTSAAELRDIVSEATVFGRRVREKIDEWDQDLARINGSGRRIVAWGAGGRGINFLNLVGAGRFIRYIVDINPTRQGGYIPGSGQKVIAPESLREYRPDVLVVTNATYEKEVRQHVHELGIECEILNLL